MSITLCILLVAILCGCANDHQSNSFKTRYNVYAELEMDTGSTELPTSKSLNNLIYKARMLVDWDIPISRIEQFADAIVRRMDAKTLSEYLELQDEIDTLYARFLETPTLPRDPENVRKHLNSAVEYCKEVTLFGFYVTRNEADIQEMIKTLHITRYLMSRHFL